MNRGNAIAITVVLSLLTNLNAALAKMETSKLFVSEVGKDDWYGFCVDISGDVAVVSSPRSDDTAIESGSVYVYRFDGLNWVEETKLEPSDAGALHWFGWSAAIDGSTIIVGSTRTEDAGLWTGSAYIFRFDGSVMSL